MDPRLQWQHVRGPDTRAASLALARANESFTRGLDSAAGVLDQYDAGRKELADQQLLDDIAGIKTEEELGAFLGSGVLDKVNISKDMRNTVLGLRSNILNQDASRASTAGQRARTSIANAVEGRRASEYEYDTNARAELNNLSGLVVGANAEGNQFGTDGRQFTRRGSHVFGNADKGVGPVKGNTGALNASPDEVLMLARTLQAEAGNQGVAGMIDVGSVIRNRATSGKYGGNSLSGVIMKPGQFSAWNGVTGYAGGEQGQNMNFQPSEEALAAAQAIVSGNYEDGTGGATHYYNPDISQPAWGASQPAFAALQEGLADSQYLNPGQVTGILGGAYAAQGAGQARLDGEGAEIADAIINNTVLNAIRDPSIVTEQDYIKSISRDHPELTDGEILQMINRGTDFVNGAGGTLLANQSVTAPDEVANHVTSIEQRTANAANSGIQARLINSLPEYKDDPSGTLMENLGIEDDDQSINRDPREFDNLVNSYADKHKVSPEIAAAALEEAFIRDPGDDRNSSFWTNPDYTRNTLENRFPEERVDDIIKKYLNQDAVGIFREGRTEGATKVGNLKAAQNRLTTLLRRKDKGDQSPGLDREIAELRAKILATQ